MKVRNIVGGFFLFVCFYLRGATEEARSPVMGHDHTDEREKNKRGCEAQSVAAAKSDIFHTQRLSVATL